MAAAPAPLMAAAEGADADADGERRGRRGRRDLRGLGRRQRDPADGGCDAVGCAGDVRFHVVVDRVVGERHADGHRDRRGAADGPASATEATLALMVEVSMALKVTVATLTPAPVPEPSPFW